MGDDGGVPRRAMGLIDLTTLAGDDTSDRVRHLCATAREHGTAAVCVYPYFLETAREALVGSAVRLAVVAGGFPAGLTPLQLRVAEVRDAARAGADEIDVVINRSHVLEGRWRKLDEEIEAFRAAAGSRTLKVILATGELGSLENVARASRTALHAGADFLKTSTGKEAVNATLPAGEVMLQAIRDHEEAGGHPAGLKAAGGIRTPEQIVQWMRLVGEEMWDPGRFRIGPAS